LSRFDGHGNLLGEYWHFGYIEGAYAADLDNDGNMEIVIAGVNDGDLLARTGFIAVLDVSKIAGETESVCTPGFGFTPSRAELYYLRTPHTDTELLESSHPGFSYMRFVPYEQDTAMSFWYSLGSGKGSLEYILSKQMRVVTVNTSSEMEDYRAKLVREGKLKGEVDRNYLENLKSQVRYWDGKEWRREVVKVGHDDLN
jgi:hypothetical protein